MIKLLALDIDGTLTRTDGSVSSVNISAVRRAQAEGVYIVLLSARPPLGVDAVAQLLGGDIYRVSCSGAVIAAPTRSVLQRHTLDIAVSRNIARFADSRKYSITLAFDDIEYHSQNHVRETLVPHVSVNSAYSVLKSGVSPLLIVAVGDEPANAIYQYCLKRYSKSVYIARHFSSDHQLESIVILNALSHKGQALVTLCRFLSIDLRNVLAIGDSESDLPMFQVAGLTVAVASGLPSVRDAATLVAPTADDDGVAWALNNLL